MISIEWPYGCCERFDGTVEEATAKIRAEADDYPFTQIKTEDDQWGTKFLEWRFGSEGRGWYFLGRITTYENPDDKRGIGIGAQSEA